MSIFTDQELELLLNDIESDRVERKRNFKTDDLRRKVKQAICSFANDFPNHNKPGILFIGVEDDGSPSNEPITDELLLNLASIKTDGNILPPPVLTVEKRTLTGAEMAVVTVFPSDTPPVKFDGRIWIRTGPRRALANAQEERILIEKRRYKNIPFDIYPIPTAKISDLSKTIFENEYLPSAFASDILEANERTYQERLSSCKMIVSPDNTTPTILGILSIGNRPQDFIPGAYIQFLRIDGLELTDPVIDAEEIMGTFVEILRRTDEKLKAHNRTSVDVTTNPTHLYTSYFPQPALLQIVYNAVLHRTYENTNSPIRIYWFNDRIEIFSPGGPFGNVTQENFGKPGVTDYRNPNIADVLKTFGFIQAFGRGIAITRKEMERNGNPPPEFVIDQSQVICILRRR